VQRYISLSTEILFKQYMDKGQKFAARGEWEQSIKNLTIALNFIPDSTEARSLLQDAQRRLELQRKVLSQNYYKEGLEAFLAGDKKKAKTLWEKALDADSENEEARRGLARLQ
jgi:tetratricopeptide (TPR) repeat protein